MGKQKKLRVLLTRQNNEVLADILRKEGADVLEMPLISTDLGFNEADIADVFSELHTYAWITFSSVNGVKGFFEAFFKEFNDIRSLGIARIACVGGATADEVKKYFLHVDVIPATATAEEMFKEIVAFESLDHLRVLCVQGNLSSDEDVKKLEKDNRAIVDVLKVYKTAAVDLKESDAAVKDFRKHGVDYVVFASPSAVDSFVKNAGKLALGENAVRPKIISIGSTTSAAIRKFGMTVAAEAKSPTAESIADAILNGGAKNCACGHNHDNGADGDCGCGHEHGEDDNHDGSCGCGCH